MATLSELVKAANDAEASMEVRVKAHEDKDAQVAADLQAQIDALKGQVASPDDLASLQTIVDNLGKVDAAAPPA